MEEDLIQVATRLNDSQVAGLRAQLQTDLMNKDSAVKISHEDVNDLIDYAMAMVMNRKTINYIINELKSEDLLDSKAADQVGLSIEQFLKDLLPKDSIQSSNVVEPVAATADTRKMISLKSHKVNALAMSGALGVSRTHGPRDGHSRKTVDATTEHAVQPSRGTKQGDSNDRANMNVESNRSFDRKSPRSQVGQSFPRGQERLAQRKDVGGLPSREEKGRDRIDASRLDGERGFSQRSDRGQNRPESLGNGAGRGPSQRPGRGRDAAERYHGNDDADLRSNTREVRYRDSGRGRGADERSRLRNNAGSISSTTKDEQPSTFRKFENRQTNEDVVHSRDVRNSEYDSRNRGPANQPAIEGSNRTAAKRTATEYSTPTGIEKRGENRNVDDDVTKSNAEQPVIQQPGNSRQSFHSRATRGGRSDFRSGRGRGQYGSANSVGNVGQANFNSNPTTPSFPNSEPPLVKKPRLSTDMETSLDPSTQYEETDNINQDVNMEGQEELYQQPYGYEYYDESQWYTDNPYYTAGAYHWGRGGRVYGRGTSFRGRSLRLGGRGPGAAVAGIDPSPTDEIQKVQTTSGAIDESTLAAAEVSPSPLVSAVFSDHSGFSHRGRGRGGRGRGGPDRAEVTAMLASKTWSRAKAVVETDANNLVSSGEN